MDPSEIWRAYEGDGRAHPAYWPPMMVKVLLYGYCIGAFSSRVTLARGCGVPTYLAPGFGIAAKR